MSSTAVDVATPDAVLAAPRTTGTTHPTRTAIHGLLALCLAGACANILTDRTLQLDFQVFYAAAEAWGRGWNPYLPGTIQQILPAPDFMPFIYPPDVLPLFHVFNFLPLAWAEGVFLALKLALAGYLFLGWSRVFLPMENRLRPWFAAFCLFGLGNTLLIDLRVGNVSLLEQALLWTGFAAYLRGRTGAFCVWLLLAASFKLTLLAFSVLLLFDGPASRRQPRQFALVWAAMAGRLALDAIISPALFGGYVHALVFIAHVRDTGAGNPCSLEFLRDLIRYNLGDGALRDFPWLLPAAYALVAAGVGGFSWRAWRALRTHPDTFQRGVTMVCLACLAYGLTVPRLKDYSCILLLVPVWLAARTALSRRRDAWLAVVVIACLAARSPFKPLSTVYAFVWHYQTLLVALTAWALLVWHALRSDDAPAAGVVNR